MQIRQGRVNDLDAMRTLYAEARGTIAALGIDQWQNGYPEREILLEDVRQGWSRVLDEAGEVVGAFALIPDGEPTYDVIEDGHWITGDENRQYMTVHRVAIAVRCRGRGYAKQLLDYVARSAREHGLSSVRIDTHEGNVVMRRMLEKNGFARCGIIRLTDGARRVAYEKTLSQEENP